MCNLFISVLKISSFLSFLHRTLHIYLLTFLSLTPRGCVTALVMQWGISSQFFPLGFFAFSFQAAHVTRLTWVTLCRSVCISFFSYDV